MNVVWRAVLISAFLFMRGSSAGPGVTQISLTEDSVKNDIGMEEDENEDDDDNPPWAERNHFFWDIGFGGSTLGGFEFSTGFGLSYGLLGVHLDYDYHHELTWTVYPSEYQKIFSLLAGPAFRLKWFRIHLATGISLLNFRARGDIDSVHIAHCDSPFGCLGANDTYYHEEVNGYAVSWPVAIKWYYARKAFGVGMKLQANVNGQHTSFSIGATLYTLIVRPGTATNHKN